MAANSEWMVIRVGPKNSKVNEPSRVHHCMDCDNGVEYSGPQWKNKSIRKLRNGSHPWLIISKCIV